MSMAKDHGAPDKAPAPLDERTMLAVSRALADPRRYGMLTQLVAAGGTLACRSIEACTSVSPATMSHHVKELETSGLVSIAREGKFAILHLRRETLDAYLSQLGESLTLPLERQP